MEEEKRLSKSETVRAIGSSIRFAVGSSPWFLGLLAAEEAISRLVPFVNAWLLARLISLLPHVAGNPAEQHRALLYVLLLGFVTALPTILSGLGDTFYRERMRVELDLAIQRKLQSAFANLPFAVYEDKRIMDAYDRAGRFARNLSTFVLYRLRNLLGSLLALVIATIAFWHFSPWLTLIIFLLTIPALWMELHMQQIREQTWRQNTLNFRKASAYEDIVQPRLIKESRLLGLVQYALDRSLHYRRIAGMSDVVVNQKAEKFRILALIIETGVEVLVLIRALQQIVAGRLPIGQFVFVQQLASQYLGALREVSFLVQDFDDLLFGVNEYTEIIDYPAEPKGEPVHNAGGDIVMNEISFRYPQAETEALHNISLRIPAGKTVAIVGENGAGKTTLVKLLMNLYHPQKGSITVDEQPLQSITPNDWHKHLGVLFQDFQIYYDFTLRENVWFGNMALKPTAPELTESLHAADAFGFAEKLPKGLDTYLGKYMDEVNGTDLSGGQSQRLAIARTLFRNPDVLILDEPTSAIDAKAEYKIFKSIEESRRGRTTILISHRFSTIRRANYIYVLDKGRVREQGTHEELMAQKGLYHEMFSKQAEGYR